MKTAYCRSPIGLLAIYGDRRGVCSLTFHTPRRAGGRRLPPELKGAVRQIRDYFRGSRRAFSLRLRLRGTLFQKKVWRELRRVPWGETVSYRELARRIGRPKAVRAVAQALGRNRVPIVVPCHRVIARDGTIGGYSGGRKRKKWLLENERGR